MALPLLRRSIMTLDMDRERFAKLVGWLIPNWAQTSLRLLPVASRVLQISLQPLGPMERLPWRTSLSGLK